MSTQVILENVEVLLPQRILFEGINWSIQKGDRVTLAGRNGSGKSTLMRIIAGHGESTGGKRILVGGRNLSIGYLDQSLLDSAVLESKHPEKREKSPVQILVNAHDTMQKSLGFDPEDCEWEARKILDGLGFTNEMMDGRLGELSGGWLLRVFLGACLVQKPEMLLLDEPTNHLDLGSIQWLESFLKEEYKGSLLLITHDIELQKRVTDSLAILYGGEFYLRRHQNNYISFLETLKTERELTEKKIDALEKEIKVNLDFAERFGAKATLAARAQSKLRIADRLTQEMDLLQARIDVIDGANYKLNFKFRSGSSGSQFPVSAKDVFYKYENQDTWVIDNFSLDVPRGSRLAIMGDNGAGKTTLLNVLSGRSQQTQGKVLRGHAVDTGYFGQHQLDELSLEDSVLENVQNKTHEKLERVRGWLGAFGFSNDEVQKKAKVLSGGERARLALLCILATPVNLLILDEPTNHLDIETKRLLGNAMKEFEGTILFVSHDREFVRWLADRIVYLRANQPPLIHIGDLDSFFEKHPECVKLDVVAAKPKKAEKKTNQPEMSYEERKKAKNQYKSLQKKVQTLEKSLYDIEEKKKVLEKAMAEQSSSDKINEYAAVQKEAARLFSEWEKNSAELEILERKFGAFN